MRTVLPTGLAIRLALLCLTLLAGASACTPASLVMGAGARIGIAAFEQRGIDGTVSDTAIQLAADAAFIDEGGHLFWPISTLVRDRRVLLVGNVRDETARATAVARVAAIDGVIEVIDRLEVGPRPPLRDDSQDTLISQRLTSALLFDSEVKAINYGFLTHNAVVYLMGSARSQWELDRVVAHARNVAYVRDVVSYAEVVPETRAETSTGTGASGAP